MVGWRIRANMEEIDVENHYAGHPTIFSIRLFYGGEFTKFPGRSSSKKGKAGNKAKSVGDGSSIKKGKDGKKGQSAGDGSSSKKGNVGKKAQSVGGGRQSGTQSACNGISSRTRKAGKKGKSIA
ncbi:unnamed protein product [Lactuca virosa]|uniref:Uncharacterized protein n=1 Tax=Lactuca virosa TaxID=75947 RepID=A0AAU9PQC4_9ASTR|nr:unnamed protein product [Lactuca virosa]